MDLLVKNEVIKLFSDKPKSGIARIKKWCADNNKDFAEETAKFFYEEKSNLNLEFVGDYLGTCTNYTYQSLGFERAPVPTSFIVS